MFRLVHAQRPCRAIYLGMQGSLLPDWANLRMALGDIPLVGRDFEFFLRPDHRLRVTNDLL